ncbi:MAG: hypothetical protein ABI469_05045 [Gemmatimonadales bacterium]
MKVLFATFSGSAIAAVFAFVAQWLLSGATTTPTFQAAALGAPGLSIMVTAVALIAGAYAAVRIHDTLETLTGFATVQLFFGPALVRQFWLSGAPWYAVVALIMVFVCTFFGASLGSRGRIADLLEPA